MTHILKVKQNGVWVDIPAVKGETGEGVPSGGTTGQVLTKKTDTDYDTEWQNADDLRMFNKEAFTVVGSPTITDDGIASGFSGSNRIEGSFTPVITPTQRVILRSKGIAHNLNASGSTAQVLGHIEGSIYNISTDVYSNYIVTMGWHQGATSAYIADLSIQEGDTVEVEVIATSTSVTLNAWINGIKHSSVSNVNGLNFGNITGFWVTHATDTYCWKGSIDLKQFSITVDGVEVLNGSIPLAERFISGITRSDVTTALGYTPYSSANPNNYTSVVESTVSGWGFTKNTGTVTSVNNVQPVNGNVTIDLNGKADTDLSNLTSTGKSTGAELAMPSHTSVPLTLGANYSTYTAPAN